MSPNCSASHSANVTHSPYARAPDLTVTLSRIGVQYLTLIFHQHTEAKDVSTSKSFLILDNSTVKTKSAVPPVLHRQLHFKYLYPLPRITRNITFHRRLNAFCRSSDLSAKIGGRMNITLYNPAYVCNKPHSRVVFMQKGIYWF
jgi:hypothetical protein